MKFCPNCESIMKRILSADKIEFECKVCATTIIGGSEDTHIMGEIIGKSISAAEYLKPIEGASQDRTNQLVDKKCSKCGLTYMAIVRVGEDETTVFCCKCGNTIYN